MNSFTVRSKNPTLSYFKNCFMLRPLNSDPIRTGPELLNIYCSSARHLMLQMDLIRKWPVLQTVYKEMLGSVHRPPPPAGAYRWMLGC